MPEKIEYSRARNQYWELGRGPWQSQALGVWERPLREKDPLGGLLERGWGWLEGLGEEEGPRLYTWYP